MKKIRIILLTGLLAFSLMACANVAAETTTMLTTTSSPVTTTPETTTVVDGNIYVYSDYQDLLDQIYANVKDEIYSDVYNQISQMVTDSMYDEIYSTVQQNLIDYFSETDISVYVAALQSKIYAITEIVNTSVVGVSTYQGTTGVSLGTGVIYYYDSANQEYYLVTNNHVVDGGDNYRIVFSDESYVTGTLLGVDANIDIAVLKFSASGLSRSFTVSNFGDSDALTPGTMVIAAGNPQGYMFYGSMTLGIVSGIHRDVDGDGVVQYIQHDASINSGNSGGPLYNLEGEIVGINVSKFASTDIEGMGFSIPSSQVLDVIAAVAPNTLS
ncbi:MAG: S1C family serine protease [Candidatus Izemoplasmatales bacterium]